MELLRCAYSAQDVWDKGMTNSVNLSLFPLPQRGNDGWPWDQRVPNRASTSRQDWPRISIVNISYNQASYLEETIRSVLLQDYPNLEYIIIDGGSTDRSKEIIEKYSPWIASWVSEPDQGQSQAINKGFALCTGEIITFISSDDIYLPGTFFDVAERYLQQPDSGAIVGGFCFSGVGKKSPGMPVESYLSAESPVDLSLGPPGKYRLHQVSTFFTCKALDMVGRYVREDMHYVMDRELLYRVCRSHQIVLSGKTYGIFRKHKDSKSVSDILPFAREFARLYETSMTGEPEKDKLRRRMARYRLARGYMKLADTKNLRVKRVRIMLHACTILPDCVFNWEYLRLWLKIVLRSR